MISPRRACGHVDMGMCPHQVLAANLTLSQPGGADYAHPILVSTPNFESHRRAWAVLMYFLYLFSLAYTILYMYQIIIIFSEDFFDL